MAKTTRDWATKTLNGQLTGRSLLGMAATTVALVGGIMAIQIKVLLPAVLNEAGKMIDRRIEKHTEQVHPDAVSRVELKIWMDGVLRRLDRIERKLE